MPSLFTPLTIRSQAFANRVWVAPMCQYSCTDGIVGDWHLAHLGSMAVGGAGLIVAEATGVTPGGRITPQCPGLWNDEQAAAWRRIVDFCKAQGAVIGVQLSHSGRKGSTHAPWLGRGSVAPDDGGWQTMAPSPIPFGTLATPREMTDDDMAAVVTAFSQGAQRAAQAGFDVIELHAAHGYLIHQFLSPLSNQRTDAFGGSLENRMRFPLDIVRAVRNAWPQERPLFVRISTTDWMDDGWDLDEAIAFCTQMRDAGVDLVDASSGGLHSDQRIGMHTEYQIERAERLRSATGMLVSAVGRIVDPAQADALVRDDRADAVFMARQFMRDPHWPLRAAHELGAEVPWPKQYRMAADWPA